MNMFTQFARGLHSAQSDFNEVMEELRGFAEVMSRKENSIELDENGTFYVTASGSLEEVLATIEAHTKKLQRIKSQKDSAV